ncbi:MAG: hypothetical protein AAGH99_09770 [Planctomycetota bacterium]
MIFSTRFRGSTALVAAALALSPVATLADEEEEDRGPHVVIGKTIGVNSLTFGFEDPNPASDPDNNSVVIPIDTFSNPVPFAGITGFQNIPFDLIQDLAFEAPGADEVAEIAEFGFEAVPETSNILLEAVSLPSNFSVFLFGQAILDDPGDTLTLGSPEFDLHPTYIFETTDPSLLDQSITGTFRFIDTTGDLASSATFDITLQIVPEPTTASLAMAGASLLLLRRRGTK